MRYLLTGGGTGGHVYPALAIADELRLAQPEARFLYVGARDKLEARVVPNRGYPLCFVRSRPFPRSRSPGALLLFAAVLALGMLKAVLILLRFRPQLIIATGGYVSAPIVLAAGLLGKLGLSRAKIFLYEPNAYPGLLNQLGGRLAHRIGVAFEQAGRWFEMRRVAVVGYPVRREVLEARREASRQRLGIPAAARVVLAFGGSGGSRAINEAVVEALPRWRQEPDLLVLHITGRYEGDDYRAVADTRRQLEAQGITGDTSAWYRCFEYMEDIQEAYAAADLVICRGGAGTLTEICVCGLPSLIVPLVTAAEDHQALNARELEQAGAAQVLYQEAFWSEGQVVSRLDGQRLACQVLEVLAAPERRQRMSEAARAAVRRDSLELILREIEDLTQGRRPAPLSLEFPERPPGLPGDPNTLLRHVQRRLRETGGVERLEAGELAYLRYQADRLLASEGWYEIPLGRRSVGIKLVGQLQYRERLPLLLAMLGDRRRASWLRRCSGGDFIHVGILRRNIVEHGIRLLRVADGVVEEALLRALREDPYFEVRAAAAQIIGELFPASEALEEALLERLGDARSGVVVQVLRALGAIAVRPQVLDRLQAFYLHPNWQFRQEVVSTLRRLLQRRVLEALAVNERMDQILAMSPYFKPEFPLKENLRQLVAEVNLLAKEGV
ncbi:MAG: glycosyltransferase [Candidatus Latescibacteria bacterium]|nr:glycosyltransferase [Candidatus Latescibacterota bacterium]